MSIATVVTRGFGSFGSIADVVTRGYDIGAFVAPVHIEANVVLTRNTASVTLTENGSVIALDANTVTGTMQ